MAIITVHLIRQMKRTASMKWNVPSYSRVVFPKWWKMLLFTLNIVRARKIEQLVSKMRLRILVPKLTTDCYGKWLNCFITIDRIALNGIFSLHDIYSNTTHVVFKDGLQSTYNKAKSWNIPIVSILWIEACKKHLILMNPNEYPIPNLEKYENPDLYEKTKVIFGAFGSPRPHKLYVMALQLNSKFSLINPNTASQVHSTGHAYEETTSANTKVKDSGRIEEDPWKQFNIINHSQ